MAHHLMMHMRGVTPLQPLQNQHESRHGIRVDRSYPIPEGLGRHQRLEWASWQ